MSWLFGDKVSWNTPDFSFAKSYVPGDLEATLYPGLNFLDYGKYSGYNALPGGLELLFENKPISDTDYKVFDPLSQQWQRFEEQNQIRDYLSQNATGQFASDLSGMDDAALMDYLNQQGWMKEAYDYGDPQYNSLYYTPYNVALGMETGTVPGMRANKQNLASIRPAVGGQFWDRATLANLMLPDITGFSLQDIIGTTNYDPSRKHYRPAGTSIDWKDPSVDNWNIGFLSETNPWEKGITPMYTGDSGRSGGAASWLGPALSMVPGLQLIGMALNAVNALYHDNPLGAALSFLPAIPGVKELTSGFTSGLSDSIGSTLFNLGLDSNFANYYGTNFLTNTALGTGVGLLQGNDIGSSLLGSALGSAGKTFIAPQISSALQNTGLPSWLSNTASSYLTGLGTSSLNQYLSGIGDTGSDFAKQTATRASAATTSPTNTDFFSGLQSGFGLPNWVNQETKQSGDTSKGVMSNNQLAGYAPDQSTQYLVG